MDASSPLKSTAAYGGGAGKFLADLPSRGLFSSSTVSTSNPGGMRVYICDHDTSPPEDQMIKTNQTNILIRSLMLKRSKGDSNSKDTKGTSPSEASRKRPADRAADNRALSSKKPVTSAQVGSRQGDKHSETEFKKELPKTELNVFFVALTRQKPKSRVPDKDIQTLTVERLRALLKEKGLSSRGRKDELIARLKDASTQL